MEKSNLKTKELEKNEKITEENQKEESVKKTEKNTKKNVLIASAVILIILVLLALSVVFAIMNINNNNIVKGVKIEGIDVSGLSREDAKSKIESIYQDKKGKEITLKYNDYETTLSPQLLEVNYDIDKGIEEAVSIGKSDNIFINNFNIVKAMLGKNNIKIEKYILTIGYKMRDIKTLLSAFKNINTDLKLRIIGVDNIECNDERVECIAPISKRELNYQIQKAEFCILPLVEKNYSYGQMTLLQQMYYGKAVITADVTSMKDYVENKETAILYEQQNVEDLQRKIEALIMDKELKRRIGLNARNSVMNKHNEKNMAKKICVFLKEII